MPDARSLAAVVIAALAASGAGCASGHKAVPVVVVMAGQTVATAKLLSIATGVCDAARQAGSDGDAARRTFFGLSHDGLHLIARGLQDNNDRDTAAALLEAKQKVEADFLAQPPDPQLMSDLHRLAAVTRSSLARFKVRAETCPES